MTDAKLMFSTLALRRTLPSDLCELSPATAPGVVSYGAADRTVDELRLALSELPDEAKPPTVARYLLPANVRIETIEVELAIPKRTGRLARAHPIALTIVIVPEPRKDPEPVAGYWVFVPVFDHACFVGRNQDLAQRVTDEVAVLPEARAFELEGWRRLLMFAPAELVPLEIELATTPLAQAQGKKALAAAERTRRATATLDGAGRKVERESAPPLVGRDALLADLGRALGGDDRGRRSVLLVGDEAAGKSALVQSWAALSARRPMWATSVSELVAGASGLGEWQERVAAVLEAAETLDAILYFDDFGALFADRTAEGGIDIGSTMRRHVVDGRVRIVGELTPAALDRAERQDVSLIGAMLRIVVPPTDLETTIAAGYEWAARWQQSEPHRPQVAEATVRAAVDLARRFLPYRAFPGKAIRLLDELRVTHDRGRDARGAGPMLGETELYAAFSWATGIPIALLADSHALAPDDVIRALRRRMIGQDAAVRRVAEAICVAKARLQPADKPLASLLFVGPTGTGKTELARSVAAYLFGAPDRMVRLDMSEYTDPWAAERLFGSGNDEGRLTAAVRSQPFGVVLLDEIEKAHPSVFDLLLQVLGEARLTDGRGRTTYFHNAIIVLTSNLGTRAARGTLGLAAGLGEDDRVRDEKRYRDAVHGAFRPELVNRLDQIVVFHPLQPAEIARVADIAVARLAERRGLTQSGVLLEISPRALEVIADRGFSAELGARALRRYIDRDVLAPAARLLARAGADGHGGTLTVRAPDEALPRSSGNKLGDLEGDALIVALYRRGAATGRKMVRSALAIGGLRRSTDRELAHAWAVAVHDRVAEIESTLATATRKHHGKTAIPGAEIARLAQEHARLSERWGACATGQGELRTAEELCLEALAHDIDAIDLIDGAIVQRQKFRRDLFGVMVALRLQKPGATLLAHTPNSRPALVAWVAMVLAAAAHEGWVATAHVYGEVQAGWQGTAAGGGWGPPHDLGWVSEHLADRAAAVLVRIAGKGADLLFGLEEGLHAFHGFGGTPGHVWVDLIEDRVEFTPMQWAALPQPPSPRQPRGSAMREVKIDEDGFVAGDDEVDVPWRELAERLPEAAITRLLAAISAGTDEDLWKWAAPLAAVLAATRAMIDGDDA